MVGRGTIAVLLALCAAIALAACGGSKDRSQPSQRQLDDAGAQLDRELEEDLGRPLKSTGKNATPKPPPPPVQPRSSQSGGNEVAENAREVAREVCGSIPQARLARELGVANDLIEISRAYGEGSTELVAPASETGCLEGLSE